MERGRCAVEADIGDEIAALRLGVEPGEIGALMRKPRALSTFKKSDVGRMCSDKGASPGAD